MMTEIVLFFSAILLLIVLALAWPVIERWHRHRAVWKSLPPDRGKLHFLDDWQEFNDGKR